MKDYINTIELLFMLAIESTRKNGSDKIYEEYKKRESIVGNDINKLEELFRWELREYKNIDKEINKLEKEKFITLSLLKLIYELNKDKEHLIDTKLIKIDHIVDEIMNMNIIKENNNE